jgi:hypothetical protein
VNSSTAFFQGQVKVSVPIPDVHGSSVKMAR